MENITTKHAVKTRIRAGADPIKTDLSITWDCSDEQLRELATSSAVIKWQQIQRDAGKIPVADTLNVSQLFVTRPRTAKAVVVRPMTPAETLEAAKTDPEFLKALQQLLDAQHRNAPIDPDATDATE